MKKGWTWPIAVAALLAAGVGANVALMMFAIDDPSFSVEPDYYEKAVNWDRHEAIVRASDALGWTAAIEVAPADILTGRAKVTVRLLDRDRRPVDGASISLEAFHNARASRIVKGTFAEGADHLYAAELPIRKPGLWEFRLEATRGTDRFYHVVDQAAPGPPS